MKAPYLIIVMILSASGNSGYGQDKTGIGQLNWIVGTWEMKLKNGTLYEAWASMNDGSLLSKGYKITGTGDTILLESVRIEYKNESYYYTSTVPDQNNQQPIPFKMTSIKNNSFIAENPDHDFPQRISYELRSDGQLYVFIDGKDNEQYQKNEFIYQLVESENVDSPNKVAALKLFEAFNKHDWKAFADCYAADAEFLDPSYGKDYVKQTHQQLIDKYARFQKAIPDLKDDIVGMYDSGDRIIVEFISSGSLPDGKQWLLPICTVLTFKNGKIIRDATYFDDEK